jgi:hypothetical protein
MDENEPNFYASPQPAMDPWTVGSFPSWARLPETSL